MTTRSFITRLRRRLRLSTLPVCAGMALLAASAFAAAPIPPNLSGGLDKLVESNLALNSANSGKSNTRAAQPTTYLSTYGKAYTSAQAAGLASDALQDAAGNLLVRVHFNGQQSYKDALAAIKAAAPSLKVTAEDAKYQSGVLNAYVNINDVPALARAKGVGLVALELAPEVQRAKGEPTPNATVNQSFPLVGTTFDAGVIQHRVDTINRYYNPGATLDLEGQNMQIGFISDSYNRTTTITAETDVTNNDLPGAAANPLNTTPVYLFLENPAAGGTDEGRAMVQIGYRMAPKAALAFGSANGGEVGFANVIRGLSGIAGFTNSGQTFAADVVVDDVSYFDEPLWQDGIIALGVEDAAAAGVSYFSSAGNNIGTNSYESVFNYVPNGTGLTAAAGNSALTGTNINLANVPTALYAGGFHNFAPAGRPQDVAQTWGSLASSGTTQPYTTIQWDDPYNQTQSFNTPAIYVAQGNIAANSGASQNFTTPSLTAGANYVITVNGTNSSGFDAIVTVTDPNNNVVVNAQDTGTDETINLFPTVTGAYKITVSAFGTTGGTYEVDVYTGNNKQITTDYNILVFDSTGTYLPGSSLVANNLSNNAPYDIARTFRSAADTTGTVQYVLSRSAVPASNVNGTRFRIDVRGNGASGVGPFEYFTVNQANTKGHSTSPSCNGTAAYSVFRPSIPEYYTSPGPATKFFDKNGNRLTTPDVRLKPVIGAADAANTSFFAGDSTSDLDVKPNFGGTSAAAPHAAAIATLVLQGHGGRRSLTPAQVTSILIRSTFPHDLDPNQATGVARATNGGKITISALSDRGLNNGSGAFNKNSISVSYVGPGSLTSLTFNPGGTKATGGNTTGGNNGIDETTTPNHLYFDNIYPGLVFEPQTVAYAVGDLTPATLTGTTAAFGSLAGAPSNGTSQYYTMALTFPGTAFTGGNTFYFTVGHAPQHDSTVSNGTGEANGLTATASTQADLFGGTVLLPQGTGTGVGMTFTGVVTNADNTTSTFTGTLNNRIGAGWSVTDGYGFINAQTAVSQTVQ